MDTTAEVIKDASDKAVKKTKETGAKLFKSGKDGAEELGDKVEKTAKKVEKEVKAKVEEVKKTADKKAKEDKK